MGLRAVATGAPMNTFLPPGPIFGIQVTEPQMIDNCAENSTTNNKTNSESEDFDGNDSESAAEDNVSSDNNSRINNIETNGKFFQIICLCSAKNI